MPAGPDTTYPHTQHLCTCANTVKQLQSSPITNHETMHACRRQGTNLVAGLLLLLASCTTGRCSTTTSTSSSRASVASSTPCPSKPPVTIKDPSKPLVLKPGSNYKLGPGQFTLGATVELQKGQVLCISGSSPQQTTILPPVIPAGSSASRLHFLQYGGRLQLSGLTLWGYATTNYSQPVGGGVLIRKARPGVADDGESATLVADNVVFKRISPRAVANEDDDSASLTFTNTSWLENSYNLVACELVEDRMLEDIFYYWVCMWSVLKASGLRGAAGLTTASSATFEGTTTFSFNRWGAIWSAPLPGKRLTLNFKGPLIMAHNSKSYREVQVAKLALPADPTDPDVLSPEGQAFTETSGLYAAGPTLLRLRRSGTFTNNTKGALYLSAKSSAQFLGAVALDRSSDAYKAGMVLVNSSASFAGPLSCSFAAPWPDANTSDSAAERYGVVSHGGCISAAGSTVVFNEQVAFLRRPGPGDFSSDVGLACSYSNIQFKGSGNFEGGAGIMWKLEACNVAAEQAVAFKNSQDSEGRQPAVMASSGNLLFKAGLAVSGNAAGGLVIKDKQRLVIQGPSMTCYNNSGTGAKYSGSHGACLYAGGKSVVVWQTATGCVQGNSCVDDTQCSTFECQPPGFPRMNATCGALFIEEDSTIDFGTSRIAFGNNTRLTPDGQMVEADIIVLAPGYQQTSADGFSCASGLKRGIGEYAIHGEVCAPGCTGAVCSCPQGTQWSAAACQCA